MTHLSLIAFAVLLAAGQLFFKKAALVGSAEHWYLSFFNIWMILALSLYGPATLLWVWILRETPLSIAYPYAALGFVIVPIGTAFFFGERLSWSYLAGSFLILSGIIVISRST